MRTHDTPDFVLDIRVKRRKSWVLLIKRFITEARQTRKKRSGCQGLEWEKRTNERSARDFQGSEIVLYGTDIVDTRHYAFVKTHRTVQNKD